MNWGSVSEFAAMGGYAPYVWGSFGVALVALAAEFIFVRHRREAIVRSLRRQARAERLDREHA
jgi:heme exporter protein D